jgi:hypothetical protein
LLGHGWIGDGLGELQPHNVEPVSNIKAERVESDHTWVFGFHPEC